MTRTGPLSEPHQPGETGGLPPTPPDTDREDDSTSLGAVDIPLPPKSSAPACVLDIDKKTPDAHVPRDPRLIRLTGSHPFNVEAPLTELFKEGFLTSPELFYVRNHGAVPDVHDADIPDWELSIEGLVDNPFILKLKDLIATFPQTTCPITLVCAGNRRKEQNQVRKSKGFSWGPAGVSTALFTGVMMADVLKRARPKKSAKYMCMEGADKLPNGYYGTSVKMGLAMDPDKGVMLAHKMNGERLRPDHGRPLRAVIPGQIGGRSVKWIKRIIISDEPSDNWYHVYDNRVLPTSVSPEQSANEPLWWKDDRYAIYDLSPNSAIAFPAHNEEIRLEGSSSFYNVQGYAYSGGGRRITRVELSIDQGRQWRLAKINYPEDKYRDSAQRELFGGSLHSSWQEYCFCWCFWELDIDLAELKVADDIIVRSMDDSMNCQPRDMYWSVLGMMNNCWYRVAIHSASGTLQFEHPTQPALMPGGWMERVKKQGGNLTDGFWGESHGGKGDGADTPESEVANEIIMTRSDVKDVITIDELRKHDTAESPWFVVNGEVYDGTAFLAEHPGGAQSIFSAAGLDSSDEFLAIHSETAKAMMPKYHIGTLDDTAKALLNADCDDRDPNAPQRSVFLEPRVWNKAVLHSKKNVSWDTRIFKFKLDFDEQTLGLPVGQHLMIRLKDPVTRESIIRSYTPISEDKQTGYIDLLIKVYFDTKERAGGKMTKAMDALPVGHFVEFKGPIGKFEYLGLGRCTLNGTIRTVKSFIMISGGSGITPVYQVLRNIMMNAEDQTRCIVLNGNRLVEDILCREELDRFANEQPERCKILHTLTQAPDHWTGLRGRIAKPLLEEHGKWNHECMALICGPEALEKSVREALRELHWPDEDVLFF